MLSWFSMAIGSPPHIPSIGIGWADQRCAVVAIFFLVLFSFSFHRPPDVKGRTRVQGWSSRVSCVLLDVVDSRKRQPGLEKLVSDGADWPSLVFFFRLEISKKIRLRYFCDPAGKNAKTKKTKRKIETCMRPRRFCCVSLLSFYILRDTWISNLNQLTAWVRPSLLLLTFARPLSSGWILLDIHRLHVSFFFSFSTSLKIFQIKNLSSYTVYFTVWVW